MKEHNIEYQTYALQPNGESIIRNLNDENELFYINPQDYINNLAQNANHFCSKLNSAEQNPNNDISDIIEQCNRVDEYRKDIKNTNIGNKLSNQISQLDNKIIILKACYKYLKKKLNDHKIENVNNIGDQYSQLKAFLNSLNDNTNDSNKNTKTEDNLNIILQFTNALTENFNYIVNLINYFAVINFNFFSVIAKSIVLMDSFIQNKNAENSNLKNLSIKMILIDQAQKPILVLEDSNNDTNESEETKYQSIILNLISTFSEQMKIKSTKDKGKSIEQYLTNKLTNFTTKLTDLVKTKFGKNYNNEVLIKELATFSSQEFKNLNKIENSIETYQYQSGSDFYWQNLLNIIKHHFLLNSKTISNNINSIFNSYIENIGDMPIKKTFEDFTSIFGKYKTNIQSSMNETIEEAIQSNNYFYIDILFQIILKNLIDQNKIEVQYHKANKIENDEKNDNEEEDIENRYKLIAQNDLVNDSATSKLFYNNNFEFYLQIDYSADPDDHLLALRDREINIISHDYSKFIVHIVDKIRDNKIIIPYYSSRTLNKIIHPQFKFNREKKKTIELTFVDKIVIFLEIAMALKKLHENNAYHGNLSTQFVFISSSNDAYLFGFSYDRKQENNLSKMGSNFYFHPPEIVKMVKSTDINDATDDNNEIINDNQQEQNEQDEEQFIDEKFVDIYSFGLFLHEVITETETQTRMGNRPRKERLDILKNSFFDFLMSGINNEYFDEENYVIDQRGDSFFGVKEIIEKCLQKEIKDRYFSFDEIIDAIKSLPIYEKNKDEIEYRILHAPNSSNYKCNLSNLVESYLRGQEDSFSDINTILNKYCSNISREEISDQKTDVIKNIFEVFDFENTNDLTYVFEDIFNSIICEYHKVKIDSNTINDLNDKLFKLSIYANTNYTIPEIGFDKNIIDSIGIKNVDFIIPIATLDFFINNFKDETKLLSFIWLHLIAKELTIIHSCGFHHGNISPNTIGIYYNNETQTFVTSIILYYYIYKKGKSNNFEKSKDVEKNQQKDIKSFFKISKLLIENTNKILGCYNNTLSIDDISFDLQNFIMNNLDNERKMIFVKNSNFNNDYSSYQITYPIMQRIFTKMDNKCFLNGLFIEIESTLRIIYEFLKNTNSYPNKSINENTPQMIQLMTNLNNKDEILNHFSSIKEKCSLILSSFIFEILPSNDQVQDFIVQKDGKLAIFIDKPKSDIKKELKVVKPKIDLIPRDRTLKRKKWYDSPVDRKVEMIELYSHSVEFLLRRYIYNLNPSLNYRLSVKISNKEYSYYQDKPLKFEDVEAMARKIGFNEIGNNNGCVVISINKSEEKK